MAKSAAIESHCDELEECRLNTKAENATACSLLLAKKFATGAI